MTIQAKSELRATLISIVKNKMMGHGITYGRFYSDKRKLNGVDGRALRFWNVSELPPDFLKFLNNELAPFNVVAELVEPTRSFHRHKSINIHSV
jgi:hypothetical protein